MRTYLLVACCCFLWACGTGGDGADAGSLTDLVADSGGADLAVPDALPDLARVADGDVTDASGTDADVAPDGLVDLLEVDGMPADLTAFEVVPDGLGDVGPDLDPTVTDSDTDGIMDADETAAGTDPQDPSSAPAWHPEWTGHPRLVFGPEALPELRSRFASPAPPYDVLAARIRGQANAAAAPPRPESYDPYHEVARARIARAAAFVALMEEDVEAATKAVGIITTLNANVEEVGFASPFITKTSIHAAEAIVYFCQAYDFLAASGLVDAADLAAAQTHIVDLVTRFEKQSTKGPIAALLMLAQNNHNIKSYAAIGTAGLLFNDRPEAARWVNRGVTEVAYYFFDFQTTVDGGYAEGPAYLNYGLGESLSFLHAYHRFAGGETYYFRNFFDTRESAPEEFAWLADPLEEAFLEQVFLWPLRIMMPGGLSPNIDDSGMSTLASGYLAALFDNPVFLWHWQLPANGLATSAGIDLAVDTFALLPPGMVGEPPAFDPEPFLVAAGNAVFRESFAADAPYLLVMGEHGKIRTHGQGHEHPEANQILLHAGGEYLLMDGGYINYEEKDAVCHAPNHNLILVDGVGPPDNELTGIGSDTYLSDRGVSGRYRSVRSSTSYAGVEFARTVVFSLDGLLVVVDRVAGSKAHGFEALWHGHGGGDSGGGFVLEDGVAVWSRDGAAVAGTCTWSGGAVERDHALYVHSLHHSSQSTHEALQCRFEGTAGTLLSVFRFGTPEVVATQEPVADPALPGQAASVAADEGTWYVLAAASGSGTASQADTPCGVLACDATVTVGRCLDDGNWAEIVEF